MSLNSSLFEDPSFLDDYIQQSKNSLGAPMKATIKNTNQRVIITKTKLEQKSYQRYKTLIILFHQEVVLADSIFLTKEKNVVYANIVTVNLQNDSRFKSLRQYANYQTEVKLLQIINKLKILIQKVHGKSQCCLNLTYDTVIVDSKQNVFLSPFVIDQGEYLQNIRTQQLPFQRAHLSPQILEQLVGKRQGRLQINKKSLFKNDYWSFGCILLEIFVLATPPFLAVDFDYQIQMYNELQQFVKQWSRIVPRQIQGLLLNCLQKSNASRTLSFERQIPVQNSDFMLFFHLQKLNNYSIRQQLQITVHLGSKYSFYFQRKSASCEGTINLDKTITVNDNQQTIEQTILNPIKITFEDQGFKEHAFINIGTLAVRENGARIWRQPLKGSYRISGGGNSRIKVNRCEYKSPEEQVLQEDSQIQVIIDKVQKQMVREVNDDNILDKDFQKKKSKDENQRSRTKSKQYRDQQNINSKKKSKSSIAKISEQIEGLRNQFFKEPLQKQSGFQKVQ